MAAADASTVTTWGDRREPYTLDELAEVIPFGWKAPKIADSAIGRNVDLFRALMRWAGQQCNARLDVLTAAMAANQDFDAPLPVSEVRATAKSVARYRARWEAIGWHSEKFITRQSARGRKGKGKPRQASLFDHASNEASQPWKAMGISRRTWYRRRASTDARQTELALEPTQIVRA